MVSCLSQNIQVVSTCATHMEGISNVSLHPAIREYNLIPYTSAHNNTLQINNFFYTWLWAIKGTSYLPVGSCTLRR